VLMLLRCLSAQQFFYSKVFAEDFCERFFKTLGLWKHKNTKQR